MASLSESVNNRRRYGAWSGTTADLTRLLGVIASQFDEVIPEHVAKSTRWEATRLEMVQRTLKADEARREKAASRGDEQTTQMYAREVERDEAEVKSAQEKLDSTRRDAEDAAMISVSLTSGEMRRTTKGAPEEIADYVSGRQFDSVEFSAPSGTVLGYSITLLGDRESGLDFRISSRDARWATAALAYIDEEIRRSVPWWRFIRNPALLFVVYAISLAVLTYNVADVLATLTTATGVYDSAGQLTAYSIIVIAVAVVAPLLVMFTRKHIRAFDVLTSGRASRGGAVVAVVGSSLGAVALSVVATRLTDWLASIGV